ncbi:reverse transcriptase [Plakobranchus ocellatus]|uniref:Reverse transcriptase n=1 Tax=Plakobranchus ocellatus TaxID=259542 RepID=A0AAV4CXC3_9GAST|nr:reverse transcriptase [Plakobranchus ocellatus]
MIQNTNSAKASRLQNMFSVSAKNSKPGQVHLARQQSASRISTATCEDIGLPVQLKAVALVSSSGGGTQSWCKSTASMDSQKKNLKDGCENWKYSIYHSQWNKGPKSSKTQKMRDAIVFHSIVTRQITLVELTVHNRLERKRLLKKRKIQTLD